MTFRDTSADTTLDNANMGTREEFKKTCEEWSPHKKNVNDELFGYDFRQPEIDALKAQVENYKEYADGVSIQLSQANKEVNALKAENERMRKAAEEACKWEGKSTVEIRHALINLRAALEGK